MGWFLPSHVDQGFIFGLLGLWHLSNTLRSYVANPKEFKSRTWYPGPGRLRCAELWILFVIVVVFIIKQLSHATEDLASGVIRSEHLMRFQHVTFALFFLAYTVVALIHESTSWLPLPDGVLNATFALGFLMELIIFHFGHHAGDNLESYVHMLMQLILASLVLLMFLEIAYPYSVIVALGRSMCLTFKGTWFFHIGLLINFPSCIPMGCTLPEDQDFPICLAPMDNMRAKAIQVLVFVAQAVGVVAFSYITYGSLLGVAWVQRCRADPEIKTLLNAYDHQVYFVLDRDNEFQNAVDAAGVPILKELPRSLSRRAGSNHSSPLPKV